MYVYNIYVYLFLGCPSGWVFFSDRCYKFVDDSPSIFDVADAACWVSIVV